MRHATINRKTTETDIQLVLNLDGVGTSKVQTGIGFFDHMLSLLSAHSFFDLTLTAKADLHIDGHHCVEDIGICLGQAFRLALGDCKGIYRYASGLFPMDEALAQIAVDICNRSTLLFKHSLSKTKVGDFDTELCDEFFRAFVEHAKISLHMYILSGQNNHHIIEACFKGLGQVLRQATEQDPKRKGTIPSTKGML
jgi:imidazoleglycerol-phosphate dehydratase